ncbi:MULTISPECIES: TRAP transporter small permease [Alphaproteobacteria]|uniref:TRAP transporter small permease protein n=2 Tax=Alphaproteobacteria TaxID=28211 RepID=A0A512HHB6_9HYPH|nr:MULTISPECIES: TRAP transporter small permease [Alphaproteobacteria]GEO84839.1 ABC transporter permease [Ciceribacter naphthalenivorans]GLR20540.1 ABC transporter permease [Ciceribacter naphthalenivorans]GLT03396.1 ABC transporter permease [Sphingomonas psychrolutea]
MTDPQHTPSSVDELAHAFEDDAGPVDLTRYAIEDWLTLAIFWGMAFCVFLQFFTRYALNNSLAWTEEIAANCLVVIVFLGSVMCVRMCRHIQVDILYRLISKRGACLLQGLVDLIVIGFFAYMTWLMWRYVAVVGSERMVTVDLPRGVVFYTVLAAFALMFLRALQNLIKDMTGAQTVREQAEEADLSQGV